VERPSCARRSSSSWVQHNRLRVVVLFEGRDSAGKGGVIKRITQRLNPREIDPAVEAVAGGEAELREALVLQFELDLLVVAVGDVTRFLGSVTGGCSKGEGFAFRRTPHP
jgi:hypothetical protein